MTEDDLARIKKAALKNPELQPFVDRAERAIRERKEDTATLITRADLECIKIAATQNPDLDGFVKRAEEALRKRQQ